MRMFQEYSTDIYLPGGLGFKRIRQKYNFQYAAMSMMTSQILNF